ncbi:MAG: hypothetical protein LH613_02090 [Chamaesiphon sp.]|nr:hypothetical protein [Chamaesiphon sp.]
MKRTDNHTLSDINDAPDLQRLVQDKRSSKRATTAKGNRRNRRYENRILNAQVDEFEDTQGESVVEDSDAELDRDDRAD